jgi:rhamnosyltransferase
MSVCGVVVTYYPDERLLESIERLKGQIDVLVVVDNTPDETSLILPDGIDIKTFKNGKNVGIAEGFNIGIRYLLEHTTCDYIVLFDQDSLPNTDMVSQLVNAYVELGRLGHKVAAVGPTLFDPRNGHTSGFVNYKRGRLRAVFPQPPQKTVDTLFIISSGMLLPRNVLDDIGIMQTGLFIDLVDTEWCLRARSAGYAIYGVADAMMEHTIGDLLMPYWFFKWRTRPLHTPIRLYYQLRNPLLVYQQKTPWRWKLIDSTLRLFLIYVFLFFCPKAQKREYRHMIFRGIMDGLAGKTGAFSER